MQRQNYNRGKNYGNRQANYRSLIDFGARGFFVTSDGNNQEKPAVREFYNLFDSCYVTEPKEVESGGDNQESVDASDELSAACAEASKNVQNQRGGDSKNRLRQIPTNVKNCLFFQTDLWIPEIYEINDKIVDKCQKDNHCRFVARCLPVENCTSAETSHFTSDMERLIHSHFVENWNEDNPPTYALEFKARNNESLKFKEVLMIVDNSVQGIAPLARVNLTSPDLSILVNVVHKNVLLSCVRNYQKKRKFSTRPPKEETGAEKSDIKSTGEQKTVDI